MDDQKIKELLSKIEAPAPDDELKNASISSALQKFEENVKNTQGIAKPTRLTDEGSIIEQFINLFKGNFMNTQFAKGLTLASVLAVTIFTAVTVYEQNGINKPAGDYTPPKIVNSAVNGGSPVIPQNEVAATDAANKDGAQNFASQQPAPPLAETEEKSAPRKSDASMMVYQSAAKKKEAVSDKGNFAGAVSNNAPAAVPASIAVNTKSIGAADRASGNNYTRSSMQEGYAVNTYAPAPALLKAQFYYQPQEISGDKFKHFESNKFINSAENSVSTFSIDVDKTSYSYVRRSLNKGIIPPKDSVRLEEMVNYFDYDYPLPQTKETPFKPSVAIYPTPWNKNTKLIHIGIKGYDIDKNTKPKSNLVFLIDTSGSMNSPDKLPLLKQAFAMLINNLNPDDTVGIVTYAGTSGVALEPTKISDKAKILSVLDSLASGGSTAGAAGITGAYDLAQKNFNSSSVNRVILATDGDFNVGISDPEALKKLIEQKRDAGIYLSVLGFGEGNYNDEIMQSLAQNGNGNAAYIDNLNEARKVLVDEASSTLFTIAKDVKIQVEFNPSKVKEYKLLGYETRALNREDFNNDKVDAGDVGSGSSVTAIYEIVTTDSNYNSVDPLRYSETTKEKAAKPTPTNGDANNGNEYAFLKIRYKLPNESESKLITQPIDKQFELASTATLNPELKFASSVAAFSLLIRNDISTSDINYSDIVKLAEEGKGTDKFGNRQEFINLVKNSEYIKPEPQPIQTEPQPEPMPMYK